MVYGGADDLVHDLKDDDYHDYKSHYTREMGWRTALQSL